MSIATYIQHTALQSRWGAGLCLLCVSAGLQSGAAYAQTSSNQGHIEIQSASLHESATNWQLVATADIQLSPEIRQGLNSGVPLHFIFDFRVKRDRTYWYDDTVLEYRHRYSLIYYELTRHYRLQSLSTGESSNYRSLITALEMLGRLQDVVVNKPVRLDSVGFDSKADVGFDARIHGGLYDKAQLYGRLSLRLDVKALPLPLQPLWSSTWKLASEDFAWSLN